MRLPPAGIQIAAVVVFLVVFAPGTVAGQERLAITPVTILDVTDGSLLVDQTVLVEGDRITDVGPVDAVLVPKGVTVVDGTDGYLIPGLWDMHVHAATQDRKDAFFRLFVANGITGVRDMFGSLEVADQARVSIESGELPGPPRLIVAGNMVDGPLGIQAGALVAATREEGRRIVDSLHTAGVPFIKIYTTLAPETYRALAERTREIDLPFAGHVPMLVRAADASDAGQRSFEHLVGVVEGCSGDEEAVLAGWQAFRDQLEAGDMTAVTKGFLKPIQRALATQDADTCRHLLDRLVENETWQVPTLVSLRGKAYLREHAAAGDSRSAYFAPPDRWTGGRPFGFPMMEEQWGILQAQYEREKEIVSIMAEVGVPLLAGSDTATPWAFPGFGLHDELELLVEVGLTPLHALQTATFNPARFFDRTDELGTVEEGKLADLVLLEANPLKDIQNTRRIRAVVADGRLYRRADLDRLLAEVKASVEQIDKQE